MDRGERGTFGPSPPSSVPTVLAVKGIAPETALAACSGRRGPGLKGQELTGPADDAVAERRVMGHAGVPVVAIERDDDVAAVHAAFLADTVDLRATGLGGPPMADLPLSPG